MAIVIGSLMMQPERPLSEDELKARIILKKLKL
jgi:hypothetical protein